MDFEIIIIGGSYAGLAAATALGRALRKVLVIDAGKPCNRQTPYSHNFLTRDGETPANISHTAKEQLETYATVKLIIGTVTGASKQHDGFELFTSSGETYTAKKILFATGIVDTMPAIPGFAECWGISILHCPYCHGYEVRYLPTGILGNGDAGFEMAKLISNWTDDLTLFTNGTSTLSAVQLHQLKAHEIKIIETPVKEIMQERGQIKSIRMQGNEHDQVKALYARLPFTQHSNLPRQLGCAFTEDGYIAVDDLSRTTTPGIYAAGDNTTMKRSIAVTVAAGTMVGAMINKELIDADFEIQDQFSENETN